jgi:hypothetical protein
MEEKPRGEKRAFARTPNILARTCSSRLLKRKTSHLLKVAKDILTQKIAFSASGFATFMAIILNVASLLICTREPDPEKVADMTTYHRITSLAELAISNTQRGVQRRSSAVRWSVWSECPRYIFVSPCRVLLVIVWPHSSPIDFVASK